MDVGESVAFECGEGLEGFSKRVCQENGQLSGMLPDCITRRMLMYK